MFLKNKNDLVVTAVGSLNYEVERPKLNEGDEAIFELKINMSIEAGDYTFSMSINQPDQSQTSGIIIDETPWIGPIKIYWNYEKYVPPFFGICGMQSSISFLTNNKSDKMNKKQRTKS